ncbi:cytochrome c biogenesis protein DipZ, partial [Mycobacterium tuberculosis]
GVGKVVNYGGGGAYDEGSAVFDYPPSLAANSFALRGRWALDYQGATSDGNDAAIKLNYHAKDVYIVVGGTGTLTVVRDGKPATLPISGPPTTHQVVAGDRLASETLEVRPSKGLQVFSFTYG